LEKKTTSEEQIPASCHIRPSVHGVLAISLVLNTV